MGVQNFDVEFEDYIIFHRGVQEVVFNTDDNHLHVIYQDGYDQDLGDPLGDRVTMAEEAGAYAAQVESLIRSKESEITNKLNSAVELSTDANTMYERTLEIGNEVQDAKEYVDEQIAGIFDDTVDGISKDAETGKYFVDLTDYSTTNGVKTIVDAWIKNIDGVEAYEEANQNTLYFINPVKANSRTTEAIKEMIDDRLEDVNGIMYDAEKQKYIVDLRDDVITSEEIHALFS